MREKDSIQKKANKTSQKRKVKQGKQSSIEQIAEKVRCLIDANNRVNESILHTVWLYSTGCSSSRTQEQIKQIKVRLKELNSALSQVSSSLAPQRKLLRLKNRANKRNGVERVHTKVKTRISKNR